MRRFIEKDHLLNAESCLAHIKIGIAPNAKSFVPPTCSSKVRCRVSAEAAGRIKDAQRQILYCIMNMQICLPAADVTMRLLDALSACGAA